MPVTLWWKEVEEERQFRSTLTCPDEHAGCGMTREVSRERQELFSFLCYAHQEKEALWFWSECFWAEKRPPGCWYRCRHPYVSTLSGQSIFPSCNPSWANHSFQHGKQVLKLTTCIDLAELNVKHTIKCLAGTRCKHSWAHNKGCWSSWSIIATTEQISLLQTDLGSTLFPLSSKQIHAVYAAL